MSMILGPDSYVALAKAVTSGEVHLEEVGESVRREVENLDETIGSIVESTASECDLPNGIVELVAIQKTFRAFGFCETRHADDFAPTDRVKSIEPRPKLGLVEYVSGMRNVLGVSWDGPVSIVEEIEPHRVIRIADDVETDHGISASVMLSEDGSIQLGSTVLRPVNSDSAFLTTGQKIDVVIREADGRNFYSGRIISDDGISFSVPLTPSQATDKSSADVRRQVAETYSIMESVASTIIPQAPVEKTIPENISEAVMDELLACDGDAADIFVLAEILCEDKALGSEAAEVVLERSVKLFEQRVGRAPAASNMVARVKQAGLVANGEVEPRKKRLPYNRPLPEKIKTIGELNPTGSKAKPADVSKLQNLLGIVNSAIQAVRVAMTSSSVPTSSRSVAASVFDLYNQVAQSTDEPWSPLRHTGSIGESVGGIQYFDEALLAEFVEADPDAKDIPPIRPGQRLIVKLGNPMQAYNAGAQKDASIDKEKMKSLYDTLVSYRQAITRLIQSPANASLNKRAARDFLGILGIVVRANGTEPWSIINAKGM